MSQKLKYVINTVEHYNTALKILHKSLIDEGVDKDDIIYVYANAKENVIKKNADNILCIHIPYNLYEFTSFIGIIYLMTQDKNFTKYNYLFLHDTCLALKGFKEKSLLVNNNFLHNYDIFWAHTSGRHNIGIFSPKAIIKAYQQCLKPFIFEKVKFSKEYAIKMEWDTVPESFRNISLPQIYADKHTSPVLLPNYTLSKIYSEKKPRSIAYLTSLNLVKYYVSMGPIRPGNFAARHPQSIE